VHAVFLQLPAWWCWGSINLSSIVSLYPHQTAQSQLQLLCPSTVNTPLLLCRQQCQRRPHSIALNFHAERSSTETAGNLNISNYTMLNTFKLQRIWLFPAHPNGLNLLSVVNSTRAKIQSETWTRFLTSNTFKTSQTWGLNHRHLLCRGLNHTPAPALRWAITLLSHGNATLSVALGRTYRTIPSTRLRRVKSTNISSVGSRRRVWTRTMTMCWRKNTPLCVSQASKMGIGSRSSWLTSQMIRLSESGNYTLSRIWNGMTITNRLSNTGVETSSKAWDDWCGSLPAPSISFMPLRVVLTAIRHGNASILQCTLRTGARRHRYAEMLEDNNVLIEVKATLRPGDKPVPLIFRSARTHLSHFAGDKKEWPVYVTMPNVSPKIRQMPSTHPVVMVALLPTPSKHCNIPQKRLDEQRQTNRDGLTEVLRRELQALTCKQNPNAESRYFNVLCADGNFRHCKPVLAA